MHYNQQQKHLKSFFLNHLIPFNGSLFFTMADWKSWKKSSHTEAPFTCSLLAHPHKRCLKPSALLKTEGTLKAASVCRLFFQLFQLLYSLVQHLPYMTFGCAWLLLFVAVANWHQWCCTLAKLIRVKCQILWKYPIDSQKILILIKKTVILFQKLSFCHLESYHLLYFLL